MYAYTQVTTMHVYVYTQLSLSIIYYVEYINIAIPSITDGSICYFNGCVGLFLLLARDNVRD